jgi:2-iminobutanoate/2-iminopropanoate deaminase
MKRIYSLAGIVAVICSLSVVTSAQKKEERAATGSQSSPVEYQSASNPNARTLSEFVRVGNILYLSGKLGTDSTNKLAAGGIGPETKQTMENIKAVLDKNGSSMDHVIKCTVMLADIKEWADMNAVYVTFFKKERLPARSAFGTSGLVNNARVEIECMATLK